MMAREEYIRIYRSNIPGAEPSLTSGEIAANLVDGKLFVGATNADGSLRNVVFNDVRASVTGIAVGHGLFTSGTTGIITLFNMGVTSFNGQTGTVSYYPPFASSSVTGVASFNPKDFGVVSGVVSSRGVTGISAGNTGIAIDGSTGEVVISNMGVLSFNGSTGHVSVSIGQTVTGDGGALIGANNSLITARLAETGKTGVASFNSTHFTVNNAGSVSLNAPYTITGNTLVSGIAAGVSSVGGNTVAINNLGVTGITAGYGLAALSSLTGTVAILPTGLTTTAPLDSFSVQGNDLYLSLGQHINLIRHSQDYVSGAGNWSPYNDSTQTNIGNNSTKGWPGGATGGISISFAANANNGIYQIWPTNSLEVNTTYTVSCWARADSGTEKCRWSYYDAQFITSYFSDDFNLTTIPQRVAFTFTTRSSNLVSNVAFGNGSGNATGTVLAWGFQLERGRFATDPIRTFGETGASTPRILQVNSGVTSVIAGHGLSSSGDSGTITLFNMGVTGVSANTNSGITISGTTGHVVFALANSGFSLRDDSQQSSTVSLGDTLTITGGTGVVFRKTSEDNYAIYSNFTINGAPPNGNDFTVQTDGKLSIPFATESVTGVASFPLEDFGVSTTGQVSLTGNVARRNTTNTFTSLQTFQGGITGTTANFRFGDIDFVYSQKISLSGNAPGLFWLGGNNRAYPPFIGFPQSGDDSIHIVGGGVVVIGNPSSLGPEYPGNDGGIVINDGTLSFEDFTTINGAVRTINGFDNNVTLTGDGGAIRGIGLTFSARPATSSLTGVASFPPTFFSVADGAVSLSGGISFRDSFNTTDVVNYNETLTLTGFGPNSIRVEQAGNNTFRFANLGVTSFNGQAGAVNYYPPIANSSGGTGLAYFRPGDFNVSATGAVTLDSNVVKGSTGNTLVSGIAAGVSSVGGNTVAINNLGVTSFNGSTGAINYYPPFASSSATGVASFDPKDFGVVTGVVSSRGVTGISAGNTGIAIDGATGEVVVSNMGVLSFNGSTGHVSVSIGQTVTGDGGALIGVSNSLITSRVASYSVTGVASFNSKQFTVDANGRVGLSGEYDTPFTLNNVKSPASLTFGTILNNTHPDPLNFQVDGQQIKLQLRAAGPLGVAGIASFNSSQFLVDSFGTVELKNAVQGVAVGASSFTGTVSITNGSNVTISTANNRITISSSVGATGNTLVSGIAAGVSAVAGNTIAINNLGVTSFNGAIGAVTYYPPIASVGATGLAAFRASNFDVSATGAVSIKSGGVPNTALANSSVTVSPGTGLGGGGSVSLGNTVTLTNRGVTSFNGLTGAVTLTGDGGAVRGVNNNAITARLGTPCGTTGVVGVRCGGTIQVDGNGLIYMSSGNPCTDCQANGTQVACEGAGCYWCACNNICYCSAQQSLCPFCFNSGEGFFDYTNSGLGVATTNGDMVNYIYLDVNNLNTYSGEFNTKTTPKLVMFDPDETGTLKTKAVSIQDLFVKNYNIFESKTPNQLAAPNKKGSNDKIELEIVTGLLAENDQGLLKGGTAYEYIRNNAISAINGCTGGTFEITGTVQEVTVTTGIDCRQIVIGLPDSVRIPHISGTGGTFSGTITANKFVGSMDGGLF